MLLPCCCCYTVYRMPASNAMRCANADRWTGRGEVRTLAHTSAFKAVCVVRIEASLWELGTLGLAFVRSGVGLKVCEICLS